MNAYCYRFISGYDWLRFARVIDKSLLPLFYMPNSVYMLQIRWDRALFAKDHIP